MKRLNLLVFEDKVGITEGYKGIWKTLCEKSGLTDELYRISTRSAYQSFSASQILHWGKNRKLPGFSTNPNTQQALIDWVKRVIEKHQPDVIVCMDPSLLFLCNSDWSQATIDTLRGGVYIVFGIPWIITFPLTAFYAKAKPKDLAKLNEGFTEKGDFEEYQSFAFAETTEDSEEPDEEDSTTEEITATFDKDSDDDKHVSRLMSQWHTPIIVPYGRLVLQFDLSKVSRILERIQNANSNN